MRYRVIEVHSKKEGSYNILLYDRDSNNSIKSMLLKRPFSDFSYAARAKLDICIILQQSSTKKELLLLDITDKTAPFNIHFVKNKKIYRPYQNVLKTLLKDAV